MLDRDKYGQFFYIRMQCNVYNTYVNKRINFTLLQTEIDYLL